MKEIAELVIQVGVGLGFVVYGVVALWKKYAPKWKAPEKPVEGDDGGDDLHTVLAIAGRLKGNAKAVALCEQLIHEMLATPKP